MTPEYNHSVSAVLKNAIDYLPPATLKDKAVGPSVGYSLVRCRRSLLEHLREIVSTFGADIREQRSRVSTLVLTSKTAFSSPPMSSMLRSASS